jgi:hypothetical protein
MLTLFDREGVLCEYCSPAEERIFTIQENGDPGFGLIFLGIKLQPDVERKLEMLLPSSDERLRRWRSATVRSRQV